MTNEQKEIALRIAHGMPGFIWTEGCSEESGVVEQELIEFVRRLLAALPKPEPVGVFADVNAMTPEHGTRWEHMVDGAYDPENGYIYLYTTPPDQSQRIAELEEHCRDFAAQAETDSGIIKADGKEIHFLRQRIAELETVVALKDEAITERTQRITELEENDKKDADYWNKLLSKLNQRIVELEQENAELRKDTEIADLARKYREAQKITESRVNSADFWKTADAADVDEIDLEETLAQLDLFKAIDAALAAKEKK